LPPYSPELNEIEPVFKHIKHHDIPIRSHTVIAVRPAIGLRSKLVELLENPIVRLVKD
jgi:transposase